tara:strand:- start:1631 stop:2005 length:375 start_codon:yes stop_codon:yes gene_type:complete
MIPGSLASRIRSAIPTDATEVSFSYAKNTFELGNGVRGLDVGIEYSGIRSDGTTFEGFKAPVYSILVAELYVDEVLTTLEKHFTAKLGKDNKHVSSNPDPAFLNNVRVSRNPNKDEMAFYATMP